MAPRSVSELIDHGIDCHRRVRRGSHCKWRIASDTISTAAQGIMCAAAATIMRTNCHSCGRRFISTLCSPTWPSYSLAQQQLRRVTSTTTASSKAPTSPPAPPPSPPGSVVRARYAPSPTGSLHLGGLRTALYNYLLARQHQQSAGGDSSSKSSFILRIEDTDQKRLVPGAVDQLIKVLRWAGVEFDEGPGKDKGYGPYVQSERLPLYRKHALQLVENGHAYPCFCTPERLSELREHQTRRGQPSTYDRLCASHPQHTLIQRIHDADATTTPYTIRHRIPQHGTTTVRDTVRGTVRFDNRTLDDSILLKSDGYPTYHLAVVVDDHTMGVTHVVRGEEWMTSAPKHVLLYKGFGWKLPVFAHLPLLLKPDGSKLSKRHADASVEYYIDAGYLPEAVVNFVAFLGWNPGSKQEVLSVDELIQHFSLARIQKGGAVVNLHKLDWFNQQHIRRRIDTQLNTLVHQMMPALTAAHPHLSHQHSDTEQYVAAVFRTLRDHVTLLPQLVTHSHYFFTAPAVDTLSVDVLASHGLSPVAASDLLGVLRGVLVGCDVFDGAALAGAMRDMCARECVEQKQLFGLLRHVLTRQERGPSVSEIVAAMGKQRVIERIDETRLALVALARSNAQQQQQVVAQA